MEEKIREFLNTYFDGRGLPETERERISGLAFAKYRELIALQAGEVYAYNQAVEAVKSEVAALNGAQYRPYSYTPRVRAKGETAAIIISVVTVLALVVGIAVGGAFLLRRGIRIAHEAASEGGLSVNSELLYYNEDDGYVAASEAEFSSDEVDALDISWPAGSVTVMPGEGNAVEIFEYCEDGVDDPLDLMRYKVKNGRLEIKYCAPAHSSNVTKHLIIGLPAEVLADLEEIAANCVSADVFIDSAVAKQIKVVNVAGETYLADCEAISCRASTVSGETVVYGVFGELEIETVSGYVDVGLFENPEELTVESVSGNVEVDLAQEPRKLDVEATGGEISVNGETSRLTAFRKSSDGTGEVEIETAAGDVWVWWG